jgi:hypothetical protein
MQSLATRPVRESPVSLDWPLSNGFLWCRTRLINEISQVLRSARAWRAVVIHSNRDGLEFAAGDVSFGRLRWDGRVDVWVPPEVRDRLVAEHF